MPTEEELEQIGQQVGMLPENNPATAETAVDTSAANTDAANAATDANNQAADTQQAANATTAANTQAANAQQAANVAATAAATAATGVPTPAATQEPEPKNGKKDKKDEKDEDEDEEEKDDKKKQESGIDGGLRSGTFQGAVDELLDASKTSAKDILGDNPDNIMGTNNIVDMGKGALSGAAKGIEAIGKGFNKMKDFFTGTPPGDTPKPPENINQQDASALDASSTTTETNSPSAGPAPGTPEADNPDPLQPRG